MKAKKWLTIITSIVSLLSLVVAVVIGKVSNCIYYDISMVLFGSAVLGFIMSLTDVNANVKCTNYCRLKCANIGASF